MLSGKRILIIEEEFLIALDIQRILEAAGTAQTVFARSVAEAESLQGRWSEFDLVLVEMSYNDKGGLALAQQIIGNGVPVAVTSSDIACRRSIPALAGVPVVLKPFEESDLLAACSAALMPR
jgi:CheY-like chemotaxis protein